MVHKIHEGMFTSKERWKVFNAFWKAETTGQSSIIFAGSKYKIKKIS